MKNIVAGIAIFLFWFLPASAQNNPHTLLWEVSKKGQTNKSYLFGTFHEVNPDFFDSIKIANEYLIKSKLLLVEAYEPNINGERKTPIYTWNKAKWDSLLNTTQQEKFDAYIKSMYGDEEMYKSSPQLLTFLLLRNYFQGICDTVNRKSFEVMDNRIIDIALKSKLEVKGLEMNQINMINTSFKTDIALSDTSSTNMILKLMDYISTANTRTEIAKVLFDYKKFDVDYHFQVISDSTEQFLTARNNNWMKAIPDYLTAKPCFIAVGFRHLTLKNGLIQQLRKLGYTVEPVKI
ncbi:TraB/GumN family protein [Pedobacter sp. ASV12]|uniref:TraB/GumN family protein n=1 Tax=Pedobacter sp. ASV12 TaxID=2795120 RepID=UPI0018EB0EAE|nr:TraB/GumN family protein [Pedobacter sp. ASV12]